MTTIAGRREEFEALCWKRVAVLAPDRQEGAAIVRDLLAAADAYAKAGRRRSPAKPPGPRKPAAVHYTAPKGTAACKPLDWGTRRWQLTMDPQAVTCGHCRKRITAAEAGEPS